MRRLQGLVSWCLLTLAGKRILSFGKEGKRSLAYSCRTTCYTACRTISRTLCGISYRSTFSECVQQPLYFHNFYYVNHISRSIAFFSESRAKCRAVSKKDWIFHPFLALLSASIKVIGLLFWTVFAVLENPKPHFSLYWLYRDPQHFLYFFPLPQGQGSFGPSMFPLRIVTQSEVQDWTKSWDCSLLRSGICSRWYFPDNMSGCVRTFPTSRVYTCTVLRFSGKGARMNKSFSSLTKS